MTQEDKNRSIQELLDVIKSYEKRIFDFDRKNEEKNFVPANYPPKEEGTYLTIRCGFTGIYTSVNEWKDGKWQMCVLDGSITIAYSRNILEL